MGISFLSLVLLLLVWAGPWSEVYAQRKAVSASEVTGTFRSYFKGKFRRSYNEILIQSLGTNKLRIEMELIYPFEVNREKVVHTGTATGEAVLKGDTAVFVPADAGRDDEPCKITLKFLKPGTLVVTSENSISCGFGFNVSADGRYKKVSRARPQFRSPTSSGSPKP